ncbi:hypothetical protein ANANG_G00029400 [Anguilla anguilla]|uniref:Uncharacterized protein n=1 Tax=Anguilla anguilla TaxID=7936 RepID=A0A9D3S6L5_ANGAN|nr:hypothetical protein ANANG_G00029400 [Anguilla anguilla]
MAQHWQESEGVRVRSCSDVCSVIRAGALLAGLARDGASGRGTGRQGQLQARASSRAPRPAPDRRPSIKAHALCPSLPEQSEFQRDGHQDKGRTGSGSPQRGEGKFTPQLRWDTK